MSQIALIALDLDGTLLNSEKKISTRNRVALAAARAQGIKVVLTTGRPLKAMDFLLEELGTAGLKEEYTITFNGGLVQRNNGEILSKVVFTKEDVERIHDETARLGLPLDAISEGTVYEIHADRKSLYSRYNPYLNFIEVDANDLPDTMSYNKCVTAFDQEFLDSDIAQIKPELFQNYEIFKSRDMLLEWCPKDVHKARGLAALATFLGFEADQVMACGDEANDLSMIQWAGLGVAMGNAVSEVKEVATLVAPMTNDQDAVAWAIENYVLKESE